MSSNQRRLAWFAGLYLASVAVLLLVTQLLRLLLKAII
jgi:hypothetical protein